MTIRKEDSMKRIIVFVLALMLLVTGCSTEPANDAGVSAPAGKPYPSPTGPSDEPTPTPAPTPTPTPMPNPDLVLPLTVNDSGKVRIQTASRNISFPYNTYVITSIGGETIVVDPALMPRRDIVEFNPVAIVSTHRDYDHVDHGWIRSYDCRKLLWEAGEIRTRDFYIRTFWSSHRDDKVDENTRHVSVVIEVDGLRIAHMGDIGQNILTEEQLEILGKIDIAFMQFENGNSNMNLVNEKGFRLTEQLNPTIVIPTHHSANALRVLEEKYGPVTEFVNCLDISKEDLPEGKLNVYRILNQYKYE